MRAFAAFFMLLAGQAGDIAAQEIPLHERRSGYDQMQPDTQGMQREDSSNPAMLSVRTGLLLWEQKSGSALKSCADCHGQADTGMRGASARYPAFDAGTSRPVDLTGRVNQCRAERQGAPVLAHESQEMLALTAYIGLQSRGMPIAPPEDARLKPFLAQGEALFSARLGQLGFSCRQCHDRNWGRRLGGALIPQGHPNGYPLYRLEWQGIGSLARRLRNCMTGMRAEPFAAGSEDAINLELFLAARARGMRVETPAVRP